MTGNSDWQVAGSQDFWDITTKVGQLKRAAIDAYMVGPRAMSWTGLIETWRKDSEHSYQADEPLGDVKLPIVGSAARCSRPDAKGQGGGVVTKDGRTLPARSQVEDFDNIRKRIDDALEKWCYLPAYQRIGEIVPELGVVRNSLVVDQAQGSDSVRDAGGVSIDGVGSLKGTFDLIQGIVTDKDFMAGAAGSAYKDEFLSQVKSMVINLGLVVKDLALAMAVQCGLWKGVRDDITSLVDACIAKCNDINHAPVWQEQLRVLQTVHEVVTPFLPADKMISTVTNTAFTVSDSLVDTSEDSPSLGSYDDVLGQLESSLEKLNQTVEALETSIRDQLVVPLLDALGDNAGLTYHFNSETVAWTSDEIGDPNAIQWPDGRVITDLAGYMRSVADVLDGGEGGGGPSLSGRCRDQDAEIVMSVARSSAIGLGQCGPGEDVRELNGALCRALDDLAWKIRGGANNLLAAYDWHLNTDETVKASLNAIAQQVENGSGITIVQEDAQKEAVDNGVPPVCVGPQSADTGGAPGQGTGDSDAGEGRGAPGSQIDPWGSLTQLGSSAADQTGTETVGRLRF